MLRANRRRLSSRADYLGSSGLDQLLESGLVVSDPVNCLLSYAYALLTKDLTAVAIAVGFDPYLEVLHRPRFGRPALALDLAEEFRPLVVESVVINVINNGEIGERDFQVRAGGVALTQNGRRSVLSAYERRLDTELTHPTYRCDPSPQEL